MTEKVADHSSTEYRPGLLRALLALAAICGLGGAAAASPITIDWAPFATTQILGMNDRGQLVGVAYDSQNDHGFIWSNGTFTPIQFPTFAYSAVFDINNNGDIVGQYGNGDIATFSAAFKRVDGVYHNIAIPGEDPNSPTGNYSAGGINDAGDIVGSAANKLFTILDGVYGTPFPGQPSTYGAGINNSREILGQSATLFTFFPGGPPTYIYIGGSAAGGGDINEAGIIGGNVSGHGFIYDHGSFTLFDFPGADMTWITAIDNTGDFAGFYQKNGVIHGFFDDDAAPPTPTPEPTTALLVAGGLLFFVARSRRWRV